MSTDNKSQPDDAAAEQLITVHPTSAMNYPPVSEWSVGGNGDGAPSDGGDFSLFHALRRHWLLALLIGSGCGITVGSALFFLQFPRPEYTAVAQIGISQTDHPIIRGTGNSSDSEPFAGYETFKETQAEKVKSRFVLITALRYLGEQSKGKGTPMPPNLKRQEEDHNGLSYLAENIHVNSLKGKELVNVSMTSTDQKEGAQIVNAVIKAYFDEVVTVERYEKKKRYSQLQQLSAESENALRAKRVELKQLCENQGTSDAQVASLQQQLLERLCGVLQEELAHLRFEQSAAQRRISQLRAIDATIKDQEVSESEIAMYLQQNSPEYRELQQKKAGIEGYLRTFINAKNSAQIPQKGLMAKELAETTKRIEEWRKTARDQVLQERKIAIGREAQQLENDIAYLGRQIAKEDEDLKAHTTEAVEKSRTSIDVQMKRAEIESLERMLQSVNSEKDHLRVELQAPLRIQVQGDPNNPADAPDSEDARLKRYLVMLAASLFSFVLPAGALILWDLRVGKINAASDVQQRLGVTVLGSVPMIPASVIGRLGTASKRSQIWRVRLTESVDGVAARLLRKAEQEQAKLILISSAMPGEGKTTLAIQLAMSLARNMRRTVLVDFDLRRPRLDGHFGVAQSPGICEALRGQGNVLEMVQTTETENLSLVTSGRWDRQVLASLSNGSVGTVLSELRDTFDFVIIDSSPILPIVDTRLVSQYVDSVVLSVFRDVSQGAKVAAAQEILQAFGVRSIEAVVTGGGGHHGYGSETDYEPSEPQNEPEVFTEDVNGFEEPRSS